MNVHSCFIKRGRASKEEERYNWYVTLRNWSRISTQCREIEMVVCTIMVNSSLI